MASTTTVIGNVAQELELRYTNAGKPFVGVTVAVNDRRRNRQTGEMEDGPTWFARGTLWGDMAENVHATVGKGMRVIGHGKIVQRDYQDKSGNPRSSVEIDFDAFGPELRWATAQVTRNQRQNDTHDTQGGTGQSAWGQSSPQGANGSQDAYFGGGDGFGDSTPF